jgi:hypothetical protein
MASAVNQSTDFYISAHGGKATSDTFILPPNVRVIMLCSDNPMTACEQNELKIFETILNDFGSNLENLITTYNTDIPSHIDKKEYQLCIFSPNFNMKHIQSLSIIKDTRFTLQHDLHYEIIQKTLFRDMDKCPDLLLTSEGIKFRTGVYNVPARFNRVYVSDYVSSSTGILKHAGLIEPIDIADLKKRYLSDKIRGVRTLNRLEKLIVQPFPTYIPKYHIKDKAYFKQEGEIETKINSEYLSYVMTINSIVVPDNDTYKSLEYYKNGGKILLSEIVYRISRENPDRLCTIMISACRPKLRESVVGIPLNQYISPTSIFDSLKPRIQKMMQEKVSRENYEYNADPIAYGFIYKESYRDWDNNIFTYKRYKYDTATVPPPYPI